jgi:glycine cleavage system H lipoate-binding protein
VNQDPYGAAWLLKLRASDSRDVDTLLDAAAYAALLKSEEK